ncbi:uncharacterized protein KIAA1614 homolog isoform X2 [Brachyhypopomus gauderio]|uniref:uncharacterized protein KIAA1614 homolog isoform X2 n=1 Tax=Brachyhypopomus gauderio TaxID=698409 RepID=UPI0040421D74
MDEKKNGLSAGGSLTLIGPPEWTMEEVGVAKEGQPVTNASQHSVSLSGHPPKPQECGDRHPSGGSWVPGSPCSSSRGPDVWLDAPASQGYTVLQSKLKVLLEREAVQKKRGRKNLHQQDMYASHTLPCARTRAWGSSSSDEETQPRAQAFTFSSTEGEPRAMKLKSDEADLHLPQSLGEGLENIEADDIYIAEQEVASAYKKPWLRPKGFWRATLPDAQLLNGGIVRGGEGPVSGLVPRKWEELQISNSVGSHPQSPVCNESSPRVAGGSRLARAESLESKNSTSSSMSLAERVEMNRGVLRQMLQKAQSKGMEGHQAPLTKQRLENTHSKGGLTDTDCDSGISLHDGEHHQRAFVSAAPLPLSPHRQQATRQSERAHMKGRSHPLKADHTILPVRRDNPALLSRVGAPVTGRVDGVSGMSWGGSGNISDSSSGDSTSSSRRRPSPTRVRFQDESEKDAETRYRERLRQRPRAAERAQGPLGSRPDLADYTSSRAEMGGAQVHHGALLHLGVGQQCGSCGTILDGGCVLASSTPSPVAPADGEVEGRVVQCWLPPTLPDRLVRIEPIRETYIGGSGGPTSPCTGGLGLGPGPGPAETCLPNGAVALPPNPYALEPAGKSPLDSNAPTAAPAGDPLSSQMLRPAPPLLQSRRSVLKPASVDHARGHRGISLMPHPSNHPVQRELPQPGGDVESSPQENQTEGSQVLVNFCPPGIQSGTAGPRQKGPAASARSEDTAVCPDHPGAKPAGLEQNQITRALKAKPAETVHGHKYEGLVQGPIGADQGTEDGPGPSPCGVSDAGPRAGGPRLSLRRFFSAMGLSAGTGPLRRGRAGSVEQLGPRTETSAADPVRVGQLRKTPSLQSLRVGSPFAQLKKSSSVQNLQCPKRKLGRSSAYTPGDEPCSPAPSRGLMRSLSVEDVGRPSALRSVGRVSQTFPDGTLLLELGRPPDGTFGFLISRGKGRQDSGVYVEDVGDSGTQKLYTGLLGAGDEIVEVNGEKVAGLSLDVVTRLMTQSTTTSLRVLPLRPPTAPTR